MFDNELIQNLIHVLANAWVEIKVAMLIYGVGLSIEYFLPAEKNQPAKHIVFNLLYSMIYVCIAAILVRSTDWIIAPLVAWAGGPLLQHSFGSGWMSEVYYTIAFFVIFDFFYYWFHRFQHKSGILWAQHKVHHADESLNITTTNRHHWLEDWLRIFLIFIPMQFLIELKPGSLGLFWSVFLLWGYLIHMNLRLPFGPLTPVLAGPQLHRIHHSTAPEHQDKNFAAFFPVFDVVFGSYWRPRRDEYPVTGLSSGQKIDTLLAANFEPFMAWKRQWSKRRARRHA